MNGEPRSSAPREPTLFEALLPVACMTGLLTLTVVAYGQTPEVALLLSTAVAAVVAGRLGHAWPEIEKAMVDAISTAMPATLMLMLIGILIGLWIEAGIVPAMIQYGLELGSPRFFLLSTFVICCVTSTVTGSSWATIGTVGIALLGIGRSMNLPLAWVAGAIISGAYFGDRTSPLSGTNVLAVAVTEAGFFDHIVHLWHTTIPSLLITFVLYLAMAWAGVAGGADMHQAAVITEAVRASFVVHPLLLVPVVLVISIIALRIPPMWALFGGSLIGAAVAVAVQGASVREVFAVALHGFVPDAALAGSTGTLFKRGGLESVYETIALILIALAMGGIMERSGMLRVLARRLLSLVHSTGSLMGMTALSCVAANILAPDQYLAIILPGRMFGQAFHDRGLEPKDLSRCLQDSGTVTSPLIPWNTCGAFSVATLGVGPIAYLPFAFFCWLCPLVCVAFAYAGLSPAPPTTGADGRRAATNGEGEPPAIRT